MKNKEKLANEYKEEKVFTEEEKTIVRIFDKIKWIARDKDGALYGYAEKPYKDNFQWIFDGVDVIDVSELSDFASNVFEFSAINWEDEEPTSREEVLR